MRSKLGPYLEWHRGRVRVTVPVPKALQAEVGKTRLKELLPTDSPLLAEALKGPVLRQFHALLAEAAKTSGGDPMKREALQWKDRLLNARQPDGPDDDDDEVGLYSVLMTERAEEIEQQRGRAAAETFVGIATGDLVSTDGHLEGYLATLRVAAKTLDIKRTNLRRFAERFPHTRDVVRREVQRWVNDLSAQGKAPKTLQRDLSDMRGYWKYLQAFEVVSDEVHPLRDLVIPKPQGKRDKRRAFEAADVPKLLRHARETWQDEALGDLIEMAMWSGCRIEELCALRVEHVSADAFDVVGAKTSAGDRQVPVHKELRPLLVRLTEASSDGFVLSGLTLNKYGDRSNAIGKRFGRLKTELGYGPEHVFHSIRKTVSTLLENAKIPENIASDILGHEKKTMTYGLYSAGASLKVKAQALAKLRYPE